MNRHPCTNKHPCCTHTHTATDPSTTTTDPATSAQEDAVAVFRQQPGDTPRDVAVRVFDKVFGSDVQRLLGMEVCGPMVALTHTTTITH